MSVSAADDPVQFVKGVGPARARHFARLGVHTVGDLLEYFPFRHEAAAAETTIEKLRPGTTATIRGEIIDVRRRRGGLTAEIHDGTDACQLRWFNISYNTRDVRLGAMVSATGRVQEYDYCLEIVQPRIEVVTEAAVSTAAKSPPRRVGVYRGNDDLKSTAISRVVQNLLNQSPLPVDEIVPAELVRKHELPSRESAIRQMHSPDGDRQLEQARARLAYEEFLLMELAIALRRDKLLSLEKGQKLHVTPEVDRRIRARFPFRLTASQDKVVREIVHDLESGRPMTRLLQGDVGSGKTVVALYACLAAIANGFQAAIMAPTEILAGQHFANVERYLRDSRVRFTLFRGGQGKKQRATALAKIESGEIDLVIGTHALIQKDVTFNKLAVVVVDEQHKFGVVQRAEFRTKGPMPHYLVMTATPIPRTLSMTVFGDLDVSIIKHAPPGRGKIVTKLVKRSQWETVMKYVRGRLEAGEQAYVVCPLIGEKQESTKPRSPERNGTSRDTSPERKRADRSSAAATRWPTASAGGEANPDVKNGAGSASRNARGNRESLTSAKEAFRKLTTGPWKGLSVGLLHGSLKSAEKQSTIEAFGSGKLHALVATTVVEVGIDVANATIMIVENADRFGLSQLHQLRGRVGRGSKESLCVLVSHKREQRGASAGASKAGERLAAMTRTTDGFKIAETDLRQRGPGELLGTRQHGLPELRFGDIVNDFALLDRARADAFEIIRKDPRLEQPQHKRMIPALRRMFGDKLALIDAA